MRSKIWKYWVLKAAYIVLGRLPLRVLYGIAHAFGDGAYLFRHDARKAVIANMRQVMGPEASNREVRAMAREVFRNASRYYADMLYLPRLDVDTFLREQLDLSGLEHLAAAREAGRGVVMVSAHYGNPEMAAQGLAAAGFPIFSITEPLVPKQLSDFTHWLRSQHGHDFQTLGFGAIKEAIKRLRSGGIVAILLDRDVTGTGEPMQFFGAETRIPLGAVELAMRTGADLMPSWASRIDGFRFHATIGPPMELVQTGDFEADLRTNAQRLLTLFEVQLRADPTQWAVLESIWRERKPVRAAS
jgi:KDO2-lipid IV(A) lauroyltransferase